MQDGSKIQTRLREEAEPLRQQVAELQGVDVHHGGAEKTADECQRFLQGVLDALPCVVAVLDEDGTILVVNAVWRSFGEANRFCGVSYNVGMNYLKMCEQATGAGADGAVVIARGIREVLARQRESFSLECASRGPQNPRWFMAWVGRFSHDGPVRVVVRYEDITEPKQMEESLRKSEERFRTLFEYAPDGYYSGFHMGESWKRSHLGCHARIVLAGGTPALLEKATCK